MTTALEYRIQLDTVRSGYDGTYCWVQARAGAIPGDPPSVVMTMQQLLLSGSDVFYALNEMRTDDMGATWSGPIEHADTLGRRTLPDGAEVVVCDFNPKWHAASGTLLGTGHTAVYVGDRLAPSPRKRGVAYAVYQNDTRTWTPWDTMRMPGDDEHFFNAGAGSAQRVDLADGTILLPIYFCPLSETDRKLYWSTVVRCTFDGQTLTYLEHGDELTAPDPRGYCEPSLTYYQGRYFLTLRNDVRGYVTVGDGLHFAEQRPWTFDDGSELGNYNTQQHWVTHSDGLFLVYTRRGANNDHVFRHRAPMFIARVDPDRLCVIRDTERILIPERGARMGNFQVTEVSPWETWITETEWMQPAGCEKYGSDNSVYAARILWDKPNELYAHRPKSLG